MTCCTFAQTTLKPGKRVARYVLAPKQLLLQHILTRQWRQACKSVHPWIKVQAKAENVYTNERPSFERTMLSTVTKQWHWKLPQHDPSVLMIAAACFLLSESQTLWAPGAPPTLQGSSS